jgi:thiamine monophosphate kinase
MIDWLYARYENEDFKICGTNFTKNLNNMKEACTKMAQTNQNSNEHKSQQVEHTA